MKRTGFAGLAALVLVMACRDALSPEQRQLRDLETAHQRWQAQNLSTYAFTLERTCFCATHPLYVLVLGNKVAGVFDLETATWVDPKAGETVEDLFTFIQNAIANRANLISAKYDATKGFPTEIDYDGAAQIADDEITYRISDVHPITSQTSP